MQKRASLVIILSTCLLLGCSGQQAFFATDTCYKQGDDPSWSSIELNDSSWVNMLWESDTIFWSRSTFIINEAKKENITLGLSIISLSAYEVYWDEKFIGSSGTVGATKNEEVPGVIQSYFVLPDSLVTKGKHMLAVRHSSFHLRKERALFFSHLEEFRQMISTPLILTALMFIFAGVFLIVGVYYLFRYAKNKQEWTILIFSITSLCFFLLIIVEYAKYLYSYPYNYHYMRLEIVRWLNYVVVSLIPLFLLMQFRIKYKWYLFAAYQVGLLATLAFYWDYYYDTYAILISKGMWFTSLLISGYAVWKKKKGSLPVLIGFLFIVSIGFIFQHDISLFVSFGALIVVMLYLLTARSKQLRLQHEASLILSERLRSELLLKNIQPHFLMNTLTSLMEWVEQSPREGVKMIAALSEEFSIISRMADRKLISIEEEIALCKSHLQVMGYRKDMQYIWSDEGIVAGEPIPPAIILTAVENGITHMENVHGNLTFTLSFSEYGSWKQYTLHTCGKAITANKEYREGTGEKYIKARLRESYGNNWCFESRSLETGWLNVLKIPTQ